MPPAPPSAPGFESGGNGFGGGFPETVDFGRNSAPVIVKRSGPPGFVVLLTLIAGAAGGVWLGEKVTHNAVAALEASTAAAAAKGRRRARRRRPTSSRRRLRKGNDREDGDAGPGWGDHHPAVRPGPTGRREGTRPGRDDRDRRAAAHRRLGRRLRRAAVRPDDLAQAPRHRSRSGRARAARPRIDERLVRAGIALQRADAGLRHRGDDRQDGAEVPARPRKRSTWRRRSRRATARWSDATPSCGGCSGCSTTWRRPRRPC